MSETTIRCTGIETCKHCQAAAGLRDDAIVEMVVDTVRPMAGMPHGYIIAALRIMADSIERHGEDSAR